MTQPFFALFTCLSYMPQEMQQFNEVFIQMSLSEEWVYEDHKIRTSYRHQNNEACLNEEFTTGISEQRLLTSFDNNLIRYSVLYN